MTTSPLAASTVTADMVWIPGGTYLMGADDQYPEEAPAHPVTVPGFWIDRHPVTNRDFDDFVRATGYRTLAERTPERGAPGAAAALHVPGSAVFVAPDPSAGAHLDDLSRWWRYVPGADWRHPGGPGSSAAAIPDHPVVHLAWADVAAFAMLTGKHVPTEAEWEFAARGGLDGATYAWGEEFTADGVHLANTWQGEFPVENTAADGFVGTSPVGVFPPNGHGLYDMIGNVWEWTADWYAGHEPPRGCCAVRDPRGGHQAGSRDAAHPEDPVPRKVLKGGSHLCAPNYCRRYRPAARMPHAVDTSTSNLGFRCVVRPGHPAEGDRAATG
ncbi:hypothetical protein GCM10010124_38440 [Pilimelia terevasa]|uniref:Sulfatase-modifying factor enzyme-like domain-containing protein n=1 Tax=Pilimelia terevasa TaxID=53372 RepID=A0A8J3BRW6_9ACTN|nr:formylglycine-generating enzyme family protein [Pilimelia terevasa]GGK41929.1 hypothetical protein GCM10010124_38440 [Pilimelia terevasa]